MTYLKNPWVLGILILVLGVVVYVFIDYFSNDTFKAEDLNPDTSKGDNFSAKNLAKTTYETLNTWFGYDFSKLMVKLNSLNDKELTALYNKFNDKYGDKGTLYSQIANTWTYSAMTEIRVNLLLERMSKLGLE